MKLKGILMSLCLIGLVGCGTNNSQVKQQALFEDMDGKETYSAVVKIMNDKVNYYQSVTDDGQNAITTEIYKIENQFCFVSKSVFEEGANETLSYTITQGTDFHTLFLGADDVYQYEYVNDYPNVVDKIHSNYLTDNRFQVYDIQRNDQGDQVVLTIKLKKSQITGGGEDYKEDKYAIDTITINQEGYIAQEEIVYYVDDQFEKISEETETIINSGFNKKTQKDFEKEIDLMKSCDGLGDKEVKDKLNLKKEV